MKTVDIFLQELDKNDFYQSAFTWKHKDKKILESLTHQLKSGVFFTENQGNLLVKILLDYKLNLEEATKESLTLLDQPTWSKEFRLIDTVKEVYISDNTSPEILIEFSYNKKIKDKLFNLSKMFNGDITSQKNNIYSLLLTENNICILIENFQEHRFNFDQKILNFYNEIREIRTNKEVTISIDKIKNDVLINKLNEDIGHIDYDDTALLHDRKIKFQYSFDGVLEENSLKNLIAKRTESDVWISNTTWSFDSIVNSLKDLKRIPLLIVFDAYNKDLCITLLESIQASLKNANIEDNVGIYFRLDNNTNKDFNSRIAELGYNSYLDSDTKVVGLHHKQLPKFLVKTQWKPQAVICFNPTFKNSKIYSYCDSVDLKICYSDTKPVLGFDYAIM
jgi:hypothetical protein